MIKLRGLTNRKIRLRKPKLFHHKLLDSFKRVCKPTYAGVYIVLCQRYGGGRWDCTSKQL